MSEAQPWLDDPQASRDTPWLADAPAHYGAPKQAPARRSAWAPQVGAGFAESTIGFPGDIANAVGDLGASLGLSYETRPNDKPTGVKTIFGDPITGFDIAPTKPGSDFAGVVPTSREITTGMGVAEPQDAGERFAREAGRFLPNALFKGSLITRGLRAGVPAAGSWAAGEATNQNPWAKLAGGLLGVLPAEVGGALLTKGVRGLGKGVTGAEVPTIPEMMASATPTPNQLNMVGSGISLSGLRPSTTQRAVDRSTAAIFERAGGVRAAAERNAPYRELGQQPRVFQAAGTPGARRMQFLGRAPGQTAAKLEGVINDEIALHPERAGRAFDEAMGNTARADMAAGIQSQFDALSPQYNALLENAHLSEADFAKTFSPIIDRLNPAEKKQLFSFIDGEKARGGAPQLSDGQELHLMRVKLGEMIDELASKGTDAFRRRELTMVRNRLTDAMETHLPGYKDLNASWRGVSQADEALGAAGESAGFASKFFNTGKTAYTDAELAKEFKALPPIAQDAALTSIRNQARMMISAKAVPSDAGGTANVVAQFQKQETVNRLRAVLGAKAEPLVKELNLLSKDYADFTFVKPRGGPDTAPLLMEGADAMATVGHFAKNPIGASLEAAVRKVADPLGEHFRNRQGDLLLRPYDAEFEAGLMAEIAKREGRRAGFKRGGLFGSMQGAHEHHR